MTKRGFIGTIVLIIIAIVLLKVWFGFDIFKWLSQPEVKEFFMRVRDVLREIWDKYLETAIKEFFRSFSQFLKRAG